jgi:hypothetical protein
VGSKSRELHLQLDMRFIHNPSQSHKASAPKNMRERYRKEERNFIRPNPKHCRRPFCWFFDVLMKSYLQESFLQCARLNYLPRKPPLFTTKFIQKIFPGVRKEEIFFYVNHRQKNFFDSKLYGNFSPNFASVFCSFSEHAIDPKKINGSRKRIESSARPSRLRSVRD